MSDRKNYVVVIIHHTGKVTKVIQAKEPKLEELQKIVGGYIERIPHFSQLAVRSGDEKKVYAYQGGHCYANEEGKLKEMPLNMLAWEVWKGQYAFVDQHLVGDVVFVAKTTEPIPAGES